MYYFILFKYLIIRLKKLFLYGHKFYLVCLPLFYLTYIFCIRLLFDRPWRDIMLPMSNFKLFLVFFVIFIWLMFINKYIIIVKTLYVKKQPFSTFFVIFAQNIKNLRLTHLNKSVKKNARITKKVQNEPKKV